MRSTILLSALLLMQLVNSIGYADPGKNAPGKKWQSDSSTWKQEQERVREEANKRLEYEHKQRKRFEEMQQEKNKQYNEMEQKTRQQERKMWR